MDYSKGFDMDKIYDLIILGGGPAGMSAGIYAMQTRLNTLLIEKEKFGGQILTTNSITNYLGFEDISGDKLSEKMHNHLLSTGITIKQEEVTKTILDKEVKEVHTHNNIYKAYSVIISIGTAIRKIGVENESKYIGKGISYTTIKDRDKFTDKIVAVIGGGNSAIEDAIYLSKKCKKVYLIHRRNEFRADKLLVEQLHEEIAENHKIELVLESKPHSIEGEDKVNALNVTYIPDNSLQTITLDGIFVAIGRGADTDIIDQIITRDSSGYILTDQYMQTNIDGVYAIGDIRNTPLRQIITATSDGAIASISANNYIKKLKKEKENNV